MNEAHDKKLEQLIDKMMKEMVVESPSIDFTSSIMSKVEIVANSNATAYKPLISIPVWIGLFALIVGALVYPLFFSTTETGLLSHLDSNVMNYNPIIEKLSRLIFSKKMIYTAVIFAVLFAVQVSFLKVHFKKR
tara:strand:- start:2969 stop:3370 length:402 start_codon:yes stop_codon:yes gene_type:complete